MAGTGLPPERAASALAGVYWVHVDARELAMRIRRPQGNPVVLAVLRSRAHWLLSGMVTELRYTGRRSGRPFVLLVQYARAGDRLAVVPQAATPRCGGGTS